MRHYKKGRKLGTDASHTRAMKKSLAGALFLNDRIKTVESRAKEIRGDVDRVITWAKKGDLHSRRLAIAALGDKELVREIFEKVKQGMFKDRQGGYTRIMKLGNRKGDNAPIVIIELISSVPAKGKKAATKAASTAAAPKDNKKATTGAAAEAKTADEAEEKIEVEAEAETETEVTDEADVKEALAEEKAEVEVKDKTEAPVEAKETPAEVEETSAEESPVEEKAGAQEKAPAEAKETPVEEEKSEGK